LKDNVCPGGVFRMYHKYVDNNYNIPTYSLKRDDACYVEYLETKQLLRQKAVDMEIQKEEFDSSFTKGRETSYGDSGTKDDLLQLKQLVYLVLMVQMNFVLLLHMNTGISLIICLAKRMEVGILLQMIIIVLLVELLMCIENT